MKSPPWLDFLKHRVRSTDQIRRLRNILDWIKIYFDTRILLRGQKGVKDMLELLWLSKFLAITHNNSYIFNVAMEPIFPV